MTVFSPWPAAARSTTVSGTLMSRKMPTLPNDCRTVGIAEHRDVVVEADERAIDAAPGAAKK